MDSALYAVYGAAGCGRGIMPIARRQLRANGIAADRLVFVDDAIEEKSINGHAVLTYEQFCDRRDVERFIAIAIADSQIRRRLSMRCIEDGSMPWTVRADNVVVMDAVTIGIGACLSPFVTLTSNIRIGRFFHANLYSYVEHDCTIGDFVTFAPGAKCNGNVVVGDHAYIGAGAILRQGRPDAPLRIGEGAIIGMGAVVTKDVAASETVVGNPARPITR